MNANAPQAPIYVPAEWADDGILSFEECCKVLRVPQRTARDWRRRRVGPHWFKLEGTGRLYITVADLRRFLTNTATSKETDR